tara:strand:- start:2866 stop:3324 length:459 start_codon:yes stop_codon:yes gene_type:complete
MANHLRTQIRDQIKTTLTGLTTTGSRVYDSRVYPLASDGTPAIIIYTKSEDSEPLDMGTNTTRIINRNLTIAVEIYVKATSSFDNTIDTCCKEIETAIYTDPTLNGLAKDCYLESTEIDFNSEGEAPLAMATLNFLTNYMNQATTPDSVTGT